MESPARNRYAHLCKSILKQLVGITLMHNVASLPRLQRTTAVTLRAVRRTKPTQTAGVQRTPRTPARMAVPGPELISVQDITNDIHLCCYFKKICGFKITSGRVTLTSTLRLEWGLFITVCLLCLRQSGTYRMTLDDFIKQVYFLLFCIKITISVKYFILWNERALSLNNIFDGCRSIVLYALKRMFKNTKLCQIKLH